MLDFLLAGGNLPFTVALGFMLGIALLEGTMTLLGAGLSNVIDSFLPESLDAADVDVDADADADMPGHSGGADAGHAEIESVSAISRLLGWLCVGRVPVLVLLVVFLTVFGLAGLLVQAVVEGVSGMLLPGILAAVPAMLVAVPSVRMIGGGIARLVPKDETAAVSTDTFIGRVATITLGKASRGNPAQAKLHDAHGQAHYVMIEPDDEEIFEAGDQVILIERNGSRFNAIRNTNAALIDD